MASQTLYKRDFCEIIASKTDFTLEEAELFYDIYYKEIMLAVGAGKTVQIRGFGKFYPHRAPARKGYNMQTGEMIEIEEKIKPEFKAGNIFKKVVAKLFKGDGNE